MIKGAPFTNSVFILLVGVLGGVYIFKPIFDQKRKEDELLKTKGTTCEGEKEVKSNNNNETSTK